MTGSLRAFCEGILRHFVRHVQWHGVDSHLGYTGTSVVLSAIIGVVTVLTGSGVSAITSLGHLVPDAAQAFNQNGIAMMLMMHTASEMLCAMSPVAGVIIIVSGFAITMVKRTIIPCLTRYVVMLITVNLIL